VLSANGDDTRQVADVESLITSGMDVIVVVPHDGKAMAKGVEVAKRANIPVIAYDRLIVDSDLELYMTFDNERVGELQAKYILDALKDAPKPIKLVRIYGSKTDNNAALFKAGQDAALKDAIASGAVEVIHEDWADDWKPENAKRIMNAAITKHGSKIDAVLASNDGTAGGAIQALKEEGITGKVVVTGQDAELVAVQRIVSGEQSMTIYKPVEALARRAAETAVALATGKPLVAKAEIDNGKRKVPTILLDVVTVTKDNVDETLVKDGFHTREAIYGKP
jgi:D-xylose transport system substrate-binding protein